MILPEGICKWLNLRSTLCVCRLLGWLEKDNIYGLVEHSLCVLADMVRSLSLPCIVASSCSPEKKGRERKFLCIHVFSGVSVVIPSKWLKRVTWPTYHYICAISSQLMNLCGPQPFYFLFSITNRLWIITRFDTKYNNIHTYTTPENTDTVSAML